MIQLLMSITLRSNHLILLIGTKQVLAQKTDYTGSYKYNYHAMTTTTAPLLHGYIYVYI
jgi:hypothetical protein